MNLFCKRPSVNSKTELSMPDKKPLILIIVTVGISDFKGRSTVFSGSDSNRSLFHTRRPVF